MKRKIAEPVAGPLTAFLISTVIFAATAFVFDRDLMRYPFVVSGSGVEQEKAAILGAVNLYNKILSDFYTSGGIPELLDEFPATKAMRHGVFRDIGFIRDSGRVLVYDRADMRPISIRLTSFRTAEAVVFEEWNYIYQQRDNRKPVTNIRGMAQGFRYRLVRDHGSWFVSEWTPVQVESTERKEFLF